MAEYGGKQRNQLSKVTGSSESKDVQLKRFIDNRPQAVSQMNFIRSIQKKPNNTGLPDNLKSGVENLSGYSMDDVKVHYDSDKPAQLNALAYTQGTDIHVAPGQEKHLPHEAWHVVQQKQDCVQPTMQLQGVNVNDNEVLEKEADVMGERAVVQGITGNSPLKDFYQLKVMSNPSDVIQSIENRKHMKAFDKRKAEITLSIQKKASVTCSKQMEDNRTSNNRVLQIINNINTGVQSSQLNEGLHQNQSQSKLIQLFTNINIENNTRRDLTEIEQARCQEIERIVNAADTDGSASDTPVMGKLQELMGGFAPPGGNQDTFALGAPSYMSLRSGTVYLPVRTISIGSRAFANHTGSTWLGRRGDYHAEMKMAQELPPMSSILATQGCCLFCYGYSRLYGLGHGTLRDNIWPNTQWTHPTMGFHIHAGPSAVGINIHINYNEDKRTFHL